MSSPRTLQSTFSTGFKGLAFAIFVAFLLATSSTYAAPTAGSADHYRIGIAKAVSQRVAVANVTLGGAIGKDVGRRSTLVTDSIEDEMTERQLQDRERAVKRHTKRGTIATHLMLHKDKTWIRHGNTTYVVAPSINDTVVAESIVTVTVNKSAHRTNKVKNGVATSTNTAATSITRAILSQVPVATRPVQSNSVTSTITPIVRIAQTTTVYASPTTTVDQIDVAESTGGTALTQTVTISVTKSSSMPTASASSSSNSTESHHHHHHHHHQEDARNGYVSMTIMVPEAMATMIAEGDKTNNTSPAHNFNPPVSSSSSSSSGPSSMVPRSTKKSSKEEDCKDETKHHKRDEKRSYSTFNIERDSNSLLRSLSSIISSRRDVIIDRED